MTAKRGCERARSGPLALHAQRRQRKGDLAMAKKGRGAVKKKKQAKGKAKTSRKGSAVKDLGAKKASAVQGGIAWGGPTTVASKVEFSSTALRNPTFSK